MILNDKPKAVEFVCDHCLQRGLTYFGRIGLTRAATKAQWPLMVTTTWVYALLASVVAANAVVALAAISKLEEPPRGTTPR
jgi:hypothetical protein